MQYLILLLAFMLSACGTTQSVNAPKTNKKRPPLVAKTNGSSCNSGNANVCIKQGIRYELGQGVTKNMKKAIEYYEKACALDHIDGCYWAAVKYRDALSDKQANTQHARELFEKLCEHQHTPGCTQLGRLMLYHPQNDQDIEKGLLLLRQTCAKDGYACNVLGNSYRQGRNVTHNRTLMHKHYRQSCALKNKWGCYLLARYSTPEELSIKERYTLYKKGCQYGQTDACIAQYYLLAHGRGVKKDEKRAADGMLHLCRQKNLDACAELASFMGKGIGYPANVPKAKKLLLRTCDAGYPRACAYLAAWYDYERYGTVFDIKQVVSLNEKACAQKSVFACINLGIMYTDGRGVKKDQKKGHDLFAMTCKRGTPFGCLNLAYSYQYGRGVKKDTVKAKQLMQGQCKNQIEEACARIGYWQVKGIIVPKDVKKGMATLKAQCEKQHGPCFLYGLTLKARGDKKGAIKAFEKQCKNDFVGTAIDSCIELVKLGQTQFKARAEKLKATQCRRLHKEYCPKKPSTKETSP